MFGSSRVEFEQHVINNADAFYCTAFRGRGVYDRIKCTSLGEARSAASTIYEDRPVMIYATKGDRQVHVENWEPSPGVSWSSRTALAARNKR